MSIVLQRCSCIPDFQPPARPGGYRRRLDLPIDSVCIRIRGGIVAMGLPRDRVGPLEPGRVRPRNHVNSVGGFAAMPSIFLSFVSLFFGVFAFLLNFLIDTA